MLEHKPGLLYQPMFSAFSNHIKMALVAASVLVAVDSPKVTAGGIIVANMGLVWAHSGNVLLFRPQVIRKMLCDFWWVRDDYPCNVPSFNYKEGFTNIINLWTSIAAA